MRSAMVEVVLLVQALLGALVRTDNSTSELYNYYSCKWCDEEAYYSPMSDGICCLDDRPYEHHELWENNMEQPRYDCESTVYIRDKYETTYLSYENASGAPSNVWMITGCTSETVTDELKSLCELPDTSENITHLIPVTSSNVHYRNKYCALCNDVSHWIEWFAELYCDVNITLSPSLLSEVRKRKCNIFFRPPENTSVHICYKKGAQISHCSISYRLVSRKCSSDPFTVPYTSYFCYYCEAELDILINELDTFQGSIEQLCLPPRADPTIKIITPPFTALINLNVVQERKQELGLEPETDTIIMDDCDPSTHFEDEKMKKCRQKLCHEERYLIGDNCVLGSETDSKFCRIYLFLIKLVPSNPTSQEDFTEDMIEQEKFQNDLYNAVTYTVLEAAPPTFIMIQDFRVYKKSDNLSVEYLVVQMLVDINWFQPDMLSDIENIFSRAMFPLLSLIDFYPTLFMYELDSFDFDGTIHDPSYYGLTTDPLKHVTLKITSHQVNSHLCRSNCNKLNKCSYLKLKSKEFPVKRENCRLSIEINQTSFMYSKWQYKMSGNYIYLCLADYNTIYDALLINPSISKKDSSRDSEKEDTMYMVHPKDILSLICVCCSVIGLLITLFTYIVFPELRSQSAINNMILCVCLLLAQLMYQFGAGQKTLSSLACALIGALCHFLWLSVMFAMNSCTMQMYTVFKSLRKLPPGINWKHTIRNCVYVFLSALLLVLVNTAMSLALSNGVDSGYGGSICYLSSQALHVITFVIPSATTIIINIVLFALVVIRIKDSYIKSANLKQERNYLGIYARLSTVTGFTWIFGYLHVLLESDLFEYLFIIFNASQGVLIMIAFVLNKRVRSLYCKRESYEEEAPNRQP